MRGSCKVTLIGIHRRFGGASDGQSTQLATNLVYSLIQARRKAHAPQPHWSKLVVTERVQHEKNTNVSLVTALVIRYDCDVAINHGRVKGCNLVDQSGAKRQRKPGDAVKQSKLVYAHLAHTILSKQVR